MAGAISEPPRFCARAGLSTHQSRFDARCPARSRRAHLGGVSRSRSPSAPCGSSVNSRSMRTKFRATRIDRSGVYFDGGEIPAATVVWAAGVLLRRPSLRCSECRSIAVGAVQIEKGSLAGEPTPGGVAIGDMAFLVDSLRGVTVPRLSPAAMQEGRTCAHQHHARRFANRREGSGHVDKGRWRRSDDRARSPRWMRVQLVASLLGSSWPRGAPLVSWSEVPQPASW